MIRNIVGFNLVDISSIQQIWETAEALYDCIRDYYMANQGEDGKVLNKKNTGVGSDHEEEG